MVLVQLFGRFLHLSLQDARLRFIVHAEHQRHRRLLWVLYRRIATDLFNGQRPMNHQIDCLRRRRLHLSSGVLLIGIVLCYTCASAASGDTETTPISERAPEIEAECWLNAQPTRLFDSPELILLEFWSVRSRESRELAEHLNALYEVYDNDRLLIVALTSDDCEDAERFARQKKLRYKIGAESESLARYKIDELPAILLVHPAKREVIERWSGRSIELRLVARAIEQRLGPPAGAGSAAHWVTSDDRTALIEGFANAQATLKAVTEQVLSEGYVLGLESLVPLDEFYRTALPRDATMQETEIRAMNHARMMLTTDDSVGYGRLWSSDRLSDEARSGIRDRVLDIARTDPDPGVRIATIHAIRKSLGQPGDPAILEALRDMRSSLGGADGRQGNPFIRASLDDAIEELDPATRTAKLDKRHNRPILRDLRRMLNQSKDPASSDWADAHAYITTAPQRTTDQLLDDYWSFKDPSNDELGRQNAALKRDGALDEIQNRILQGEIRDLSMVKDHLARALSEEPDEWVRRRVVDGLWELAKRGGRAMRQEIITLFEVRAGEESDRYVQARLEGYVADLQNQ